MVHVTKDGERMFICQMDDDHLVNTINMFLRSIEADLGSMRDLVDPRQAKILGINADELERKASKRVPAKLASLYAYLSEALLRFGLDEIGHIQRDLRRVLGRESALPKFGVPRLDTSKSRVTVSDVFEEER